MSILLGIHKLRGECVFLLFAIILCAIPLAAAGQAPRYSVTFGQQGNELEMRVAPARSAVATQTMPAARDPRVNAIAGTPSAGTTTVVAPLAGRTPIQLKSQSVADYKEDGFDVSLIAIAAEALGAYLDASGRISVDGILFDFNLADIKNESLPPLNTILALMRARPTLKICIEGYTDYVGSVDENLVLSAQRAYSVKRWLVEHGIASTRVDYVGRGPRGGPGDDEAAMARNRRVDILKVSE